MMHILLILTSLNDVIVNSSGLDGLVIPNS